MSTPPSIMAPIGQTIDGGFEIIERLGRGGMGEVYRAAHAATGRTAAVKILRCPQDERFQREIVTLAGLSHPGIPAYVASGTLASGEPYLAMQLIEGETLADLIAKAEGKSGGDRLGFLEAAIHLLADVARALAYAHERGVVHRDLKPGNIIAGRWSGDIRGFVVDFGIALETSEKNRLTAPSSLLGTPSYVSPEQIRGEPISGSADIYAMGVILYECVAGRVPFFGEPAAILHAHLQARPPPIELPAHIKPLEELIARMLAKKPEDRPPNMHAVERELAVARAAALRAGESVEVSPPSEPRSEVAAVSIQREHVASRASRRRLVRPWMIGVAIALAIIIAGMALRERLPAGAAETAAIVEETAPAPVVSAPAAAAPAQPEAAQPEAAQPEGVPPAPKPKPAKIRKTAAESELGERTFR